MIFNDCSSYIYIYMYPNHPNNSYCFPLLRPSSPNKNTHWGQVSMADSPRNHNHSKTVAIGHGLVTTNSWRAKAAVHVTNIDRSSNQCHFCHLQISSLQKNAKLLKCSRNQSRSEQIRAGNNPLWCLRNGSSMILQSFLLRSFEQSWVAKRWLWVALQGTNFSL